MPLVTCRCRKNGCGAVGGLSVQKSTFDRHRRADLAAQAQALQERSEKVLSDQEDQVAAFLSTMTLADRIASSQTAPRFWAGSTEDQPEDSSSNIFPMPKPDAADFDDNLNHRQRVAHHLDRLKELESQLDSISDEVLPQLSSLAEPQNPASPFPLRGSLSIVRDVQRQLDNIRFKAQAVLQAKAAIVIRSESLLQKLQAAERTWSKRVKVLAAGDVPTPPAHSFNSDHHFRPILNGTDTIIQLAVFVMVVMNAIMDVPRRGCKFILESLTYIVQLALLRHSTNLGPTDQKLMSDFPRDPDTAKKAFLLDSQATILAVCPSGKCHKTYKPSYLDGSPIAHYPVHCTHRHFINGKKCRERLTRPRIIQGVEIQVPIKAFVSFDFKDWLAGLLSRPGYEDKMDAAWDSVLSPQSDHEMRDIFDGQYLRGFKFKGKHFGIGGEEGRYVFSLSVDYFNPYTNKQAGKKASVGVISLVCLNIPPSMRYKPENMFLAGVIPGPNEPPLNLLNHYLSPLVDDLLEFWELSVKYSQTYNYPNGRSIRCALIAVICDLLALRKTSGFAACTHEHFCSVCHCTRSQQGYGDTNFHAWPRRTNIECRIAAEHHRVAEDEVSQKQIFNENGVRWSELLRLPYFDVVKCSVVDSMHNLFLGLVKEHFESILGIGKPTTAEGPACTINIRSAPHYFTSVEKKSTARLRKWFEAPMDDIFPDDRAACLKKLTSIHLRALEFACAELNLIVPPIDRAVTPKKQTHTKMDFANVLWDWRLEQPEARSTGADTSTRHGQVFTPEETHAVRLAIQEMATPSWLTSVPSNLGSAAHGKLKADQWRALGTTHLPLALVRLWGVANEDEPRSLRCREILDVTISLLSAITIASSHIMSPPLANLYLQHMTAYLEGVKKLFPEYKVHPNHHMAFHLHEYLILFGPVHAWWTFPFERLIGMLQRFSTSGKMGELEITMGKSFTRSANLRALLLKPQCPEVIRNCRALFGKLVDPQMRNTLQTDMHSILGTAINLTTEDEESATSIIPWNIRTAQAIPKSFVPLLQQKLQIPIPPRAQFPSHFAINGFNFAVSDKHVGNSCVMVTLGEGRGTAPARIESIIQLLVSDSVETFLAIRCHPSTHRPWDPCADFPDLPIHLWDANLGELEIITPNQVHSHFAALHWQQQQEQYILAMSLSRSVGA